MRIFDQFQKKDIEKAQQKLFFSIMKHEQ